jgi:hypothetical protein
MDWFLAIFAAVWLTLAIVGVVSGIRSGQQSFWTGSLFGLLLVVGAGGFFASLLSAMGAFELPRNVEWPSGAVDGVADLSGGGYVVPLDFCGRVQVYDSRWKFLRGWNIQAHGGVFSVRTSPAGTISVYTARGRHQYAYSPAGDLLSSETYSGALPARDGRAVIVPTHPLLWVFSGAFASLITAMIGMVGGGLMRSRRKRAARPGTNPPAS